MEVSSQEQEAVAVAVAATGGGGEFPLLLPGINNNNNNNTTNGHDDGGGRHHMHHHHLIMNHLHNNIISPSSGSSSVVLLPHQQNHTTTNGSLQQQSEEKEGGEVVPAAVPYKKMKMKKKLLVGVGSSSPPRPSYVYKECLKNHAAGMGSIATDGCGEFMPSEEEDGTLQPLTCSACRCHRNFHRKQLAVIHDYHQQYFHTTTTTKFILGHPEPLSLAYHPNSINILPSRVVPPMIMQLQPSSDRGDQQELEGVIAPPPPPPHPRVNIIKKRRFRTKFSKEQKEQMLRFAERVGWKIQKQEESLVQQVCQEIGVKRRVLKVWMHNNKHNRRSS